MGVNCFVSCLYFSSLSLSFKWFDKLPSVVFSSRLSPGDSWYKCRELCQLMGKFELECTPCYQGTVWNYIFGYCLQEVKTCSTVWWQWKLLTLTQQNKNCSKTPTLHYHILCFTCFFCHFLAFPHNVKLGFYWIWKMHFYPVCLLPGSSGVLLGLKAMVQSQPLLTSIPSATLSPALFTILSLFF